MKRVGRVTLLVLLLICLIVGTIHAAAADDLLGTVVDGSVLTDGTEAEGIAYPKQRGSYLSSGSGRVTIAGTGKVTILGSTSAYQTVDEIKVTLHLQRLENGSWVHVLTMGPKTAYNSSYVSNSRTYSVTGGYYYRVTGAHTTVEGGTVETVSSATNGVWVS